MTDFSVSIVIHHPDRDMLLQTVRSLEQALAHLRSRHPGGRVPLAVIDNSVPPCRPEMWLRAARGAPFQWLDIRVVSGQGNVGFGRGHNLALTGLDGRYHLILNPDVELAEDAVLRALAFLDAHPDVVALSPRVSGGDGRLQYLCRRYPSLTDLFVRGFLPRAWRTAFDARLARYEMRAETDELENRFTEPAGAGEEVFLRPRIISGCFMLFRRDTLTALGGFDPRYFLYFEDYDLSLRAGKLGALAYVPGVRIVHHGGGAARKGGRHIRMFVASALKFFTRFGWRWR
ncbi:MAG: glycosyltransferase family 2 protein [Janthinobacterium lividum]